MEYLRTWVVRIDSDVYFIKFFWCILMVDLYYFSNTNGLFLPSEKIDV